MPRCKKKVLSRFCQELSRNFLGLIALIRSYQELINIYHEMIQCLNNVSSFASPHRTSSVNQYWPIVNASLPCNIICSLSRLKFASNKRIRISQKTKIKQSRWRSEKDKRQRIWRAWVRSPYGTFFLHLY